jgi:AraC-like DNA-binding protein
VDGGRIGRLEQQARRLGFDDLRGFLQIRCDAGHSIPRLAQELGVSQPTVTQALATLSVALPPRPQRLSLQRRGHAQQRIALRVIELGFAAVGAYLEDRLIQREWLLVDVAAELGAHRATVRRVMQQVGVRRGRRTAKQLAVAERGPAGAIGRLADTARRAAGRAWVCGSGCLPGVPPCGAGLVGQADAG